MVDMLIVKLYRKRVEAVVVSDYEIASDRHAVGASRRDNDDEMAYELQGGSVWGHLRYRC